MRFVEAMQRGFVRLDGCLPIGHAAFIRRGLRRAQDRLLRRGLVLDDAQPIDHIDALRDPFSGAADITNGLIRPDPHALDADGITLAALDVYRDADTIRGHVHGRMFLAGRPGQLLLYLFADLSAHRLTSRSEEHTSELQS